MPCTPIHAALSKLSYVLQTHPKVIIPLFFKCHIKGLLIKFISLSILHPILIFNSDLLFAFALTTHQSSNYWEYIGICKDDYLIGINGNKPVI